MIQYTKIKYSSLRLKVDTWKRFKEGKPKRITHDDFLNELLDMYNDKMR